MDIKRYARDHETLVQEALLTGTTPQNWNALRKRHERVLRFMQHERLVHLLVTLAFGVFLLISMIGAFIKPDLLPLLLMGMFLLLLFPYIFHYYFLENSVQRWYRLMDDIEKKIEETEKTAG